MKASLCMATSADLTDKDGGFTRFLEKMADTSEAKNDGAVLFNLDPKADVYRPSWPPGRGKAVTVKSWTVKSTLQFLQLFHIASAGEANVSWAEYAGDVPADPPTGLSDAEIAALEKKGWESLTEKGGYDYAQDLDMPRKSSKAPLGEVLRYLPGIVRGGKLAGITDLFAYFGKRYSFFSIHVEDMLLRSVNLLHGGWPKIWIVVHPRHYRAVERALRQMVPLYSSCGDWLRHKTFLMLPELLSANGIPWTRIIQRPGQGVMTMEGAIHFGMNLGPNVATAWNCATRGWLRWGRVSSHCACSPHSVSIHVEELARCFLQAEVEDPAGAVRKDAEPDLTAIWLRFRYDFGGCSLFHPPPFPPATPRVLSKPLPLRYLRVNGFNLIFANYSNGTYQYRCRQKTSASCPVNLLLDEHGWGSYRWGAKREHTHPSPTDSDLSEAQELELVTLQESKKVIAASMVLPP